MNKGFRRLVLTGVPLVLAGCVVPPEGTTMEDMAAYEAAVASIGCELVGESDYLPVEIQAGLTRQQTLDITARMLATERAVKLENGGTRLITGACA